MDVVNFVECEKVTYELDPSFKAFNESMLGVQYCPERLNYTRFISIKDYFKQIDLNPTIHLMNMCDKTCVQNYGTLLSLADTVSVTIHMMQGSAKLNLYNADGSPPIQNSIEQIKQFQFGDVMRTWMKDSQKLQLNTISTKDSILGSLQSDY